MAGGALRGAPDPPAGGGLPRARLAKRGRRRSTGSVATRQPLRRERDRDPAWLADYGRRAGEPKPPPLAEVTARGGPRPARARADLGPRGRHRPRARGA